MYIYPIYSLSFIHMYIYTVYIFKYRDIMLPLNYVYKHAISCDVELHLAIPKCTTAQRCQICCKKLVLLDQVFFLRSFC